MDIMEEIYSYVVRNITGNKHFSHKDMKLLQYLFDNGFPVDYDDNFLLNYAVQYYYQRCETAVFFLLDNGAKLTPERIMDIIRYPTFYKKLITYLNKRNLTLIGSYYEDMKPDMLRTIRDYL